MYQFLKILTEKLEPCFSNSRISPQVRVHTYMCVYSWVCNKLESCFSNSRFYPQFIENIHICMCIYRCILVNIRICVTHIFSTVGSFCSRRIDFIWRYQRHFELTGWVIENRATLIWSKSKSGLKIMKWLF